MEDSVSRLLVAPTVIIPACGLLALSASARLTALIARIRAMHRERIDVYLDPRDDPRARSVQRMRREGIDLMTGRMLRRAALMRATLMLLFGGVICLVVSSLLLGLSAFADDMEAGAIVAFSAGLLFVMLAMITALMDVACSLEAVRFEHDRVVRLCEAEGAPA